MHICVYCFVQWLMQTEGGRLEADGLEKTWRFDQHAIAKEVDVASRKNLFDIVLPGLYIVLQSLQNVFCNSSTKKSHPLLYKVI